MFQCFDIFRFARPDRFVSFRNDKRLLPRQRQRLDRLGSTRTDTIRLDPIDGPSLFAPSSQLSASHGTSHVVRSCATTNDLSNRSVSRIGAWKHAANINTHTSRSRFELSVDEMVSTCLSHWIYTEQDQPYQQSRAEQSKAKQSRAKQRSRFTRPQISGQGP